MALSYDLAKLSTAIIIAICLLQYGVRLLGTLIGRWVRSRTRQRRELLLSRATEEGEQQSEKNLQTSEQPASSSTSSDSEWEKINTGSKSSPSAPLSKSDDNYSGVIGFFHPFCNAGGGGERVLFAAIHATQLRYPKALCVVYTGDHDVDKQQILTNAQNRFNITLYAPQISFLYLTTREWVLASRYPHFTLLGQSLGSLVMGWDAFNLLVPDIFIDTMGYAFVFALGKWLFPSLPTGAYVHYPTISTDMLGSLHDESPGRGVNAGLGKGTRGKAKQWYWEMFASLYSWVGGHVDVVMTNSTWTQRHIESLWGVARTKHGKNNPITIVYPPCAVEDLHQNIPLDSTTEKDRTNNILYISQFRPEKVHSTIISAFTTFLKSSDPSASKPKLILAGSVRDDQDEKHVYKLRLQAQPIKEHVDFVVNAKWPKLLELLRSSSIGANGMWNEHFGIGVVEYQAAGLICVVNDSGGPKEDIVVDFEGQPTGFHASTIEEFAESFKKALSLSPEDAFAMRHRARQNSLRFSESVFGSAWSAQLDRLIDMSPSRG